MDQELNDFIDEIRTPALAIEAVSGIPWRFAMIQACHESRYGQSLLTKQANNLFGITGDTWAAEGKPVYWIITTEYNKENVPFEIRRPFRKYDDWLGSLQDWSGLIQRRYPLALVAAKAGKFDDFAKALQAGGYATDPHYATQLIALNEKLSTDLA